MDAVTPKCPSCHAPVQSDWDWCQACGYDPDELRPPGWISPALYQLESADEAGGGSTVTKTKTRTKGRKSRRRQKGAADDSPRPPLIELPDNLAPAHDPISDGRSVVRHTTPAPQPPEPAPAERNRRRSDRKRSDRNRTEDDRAQDHPAAPPAAALIPAPAPRAVDHSIDHSVGQSVQRPADPTSPEPSGPSHRAAPAPAARPAVVAGDGRVYRVAATPPEMIGAAVLLVAAAGLAYLTVRGILQVATGASTSALDNVSTVVFVVVCAVIAFAAAAQGLALVRQRVVLDGDELVAHNRFGRVQKVAIVDIYAIRLSQRQYQTPRGLSQAIETPYLQRGDGSGFWLDALGGRSPGAGPSDQQLALFEQLEAAVARRKPPRPTLGTEPGSDLGI